MWLVDNLGLICLSAETFVLISREPVECFYGCHYLAAIFIRISVLNIQFNHSTNISIIYIWLVCIWLFCQPDFTNVDLVQHFALIAMKKTSRSHLKSQSNIYRHATRLKRHNIGPYQTSLSLIFNKKGQTGKQQNCIKLMLYVSFSDSMVYFVVKFMIPHVDFSPLT